MSKAIVLVAFGSTNLEGIKKSIGLLEKDLNNYFGKEYTIFKAFTSNKIIELLKEKNASDIVVFGGGVIPETDIPGLLDAGVAHIFTPGTPTDETVKFLEENVKPKSIA